MKIDGTFNRPTNLREFRYAVKPSRGDRTNQLQNKYGDDKLFSERKIAEIFFLLCAVERYVVHSSLAL